MIFILLWIPLTAHAQEETQALFLIEEGGFTSQFPTGISVTLPVIPQRKITQASLYLTMDDVVMYEGETLIPAHRPQQRVILTGTWDGLTITGEISPPWIQLKLWWQLIDETGSSMMTAPTVYQYETHHRRWQEYAGDSVRVYGYGQSHAFLENAARTADEAILRLEQSYGYGLPYAPALVFYNSAAEGDADLSQLAFGAYFAGRAYPGTNGIVILAAENHPNVIAHELAHLFQFQLGGQFFDAPQWWREGDAKLHESSVTIEKGITRARQLADQQQLPDLATWNELPTSKEKVEDMMAIGLSFGVYLQTVYGQASHALFYENWRHSRDFAQTFELTYGQNLAALLTGWQIWLMTSPE